MQYILDEQEMEEVKLMRALLRALPTIEKLQEICTKAANEWHSWRGWDGTAKLTSWDCILTEDYEHTCDCCPVRDICPNPYKEWSK